MAKESVTVTCSPSDEKINETIFRYESFGWELIGNQRCNEYSKYYTTSYNEMTFSREKSAKWYDTVLTLENEYTSKSEEVDNITKTQPAAPSKSDFNSQGIMLMCFGFAFALVGIFLIILSSVGLIKYYWSFIPFGFAVIMFACIIFSWCNFKKRNAVYIKELDRWRLNNDRKIDALKGQMKDLAQQASDFINASEKSFLNQ